MSRRLRASVTIWALLMWTFVILPCMALTIELPMVISARVMVVHALRSAGVAAYQQCTDFDSYQQGSGPPQQLTPCVENEAQMLFTTYMTLQSLEAARGATLTVTTIPGSNDHLLTGCFSFQSTIVPAAVLPALICASETAQFELSHG